MKKYILIIAVMSMILNACAANEENETVIPNSGNVINHLPSGEEKQSELPLMDYTDNENVNETEKTENVSDYSQPISESNNDVDNNVESNELDGSWREEKQIDESMTEEQPAVTIEPEVNKNDVIIPTDEGENLIEGDNEMKHLVITIGSKKFTVTLYENETAKALLNQLPLTITMGELNGNEKYYYLDENLPVNAIRPNQIQTGDLMLFGSDCLVLFYKDFISSYSYTKLGYAANADELAEALGTGSIQVVFDFE
ncbi:cyclophilin-like fold protein [Dielma fastidiosa]|uniref:Cyclophilin-like domain-containing protein n=1 Tax=Dielma fastidiosa TaxID=1034346 RepID=A0A318KFA4_9FIRM|nr:cyclophilin-like fold protein [Dielma fastidiosa]PXX76824.1 hypothetical protein DES51_11318 [Dielma fastidiosa]